MEGLLQFMFHDLYIYIYCFLFRRQADRHARSIARSSAPIDVITQRWISVHSSVINHFPTLNKKKYLWNGRALNKSFEFRYFILTKNHYNLIISMDWVYVTVLNFFFFCRREEESQARYQARINASDDELSQR